MNIYEKKKYHLSLAGRGNPWKVITSRRKSILSALHDCLPLKKIAETFSLTLPELISEIKPMVEASLVIKKGESYYPAFLISNLNETLKIYEHSKETGKIIADFISSIWEEIEKDYKQLSISQSQSFSDSSFFFIGGRILDMGMLEAFIKDKTLLTSAPKRPSPDYLDAQYYYWMVEGEKEHLGNYGEESKSLPWQNWKFLSFGKNHISGRYNAPRVKFEQKCDELVKSDKMKKPEELAEALNIPILSREDSLVWHKVTKKYSDKILILFKKSTDNFKALYNELQTSKFIEWGFGEFFCWYFHLVYTWTIDFLIKDKLILEPSDNYSAIIMYLEKEEGVLVP